MRKYARRAGWAISALGSGISTAQLLSIGRSLEETIIRLKALPGIGEWTAQYIALRGMREPDAFTTAEKAAWAGYLPPKGADAATRRCRPRCLPPQTNGCLGRLDPQ
jgi:hypothetical protein